MMAVFYRLLIYAPISFQLNEDKIRAIQEKLQLSEQKLEQFSKLPDIEEELKQRMEALNQVRNSWLTIRSFLIIYYYVIFLSNSGKLKKYF